MIKYEILRIHKPYLRDIKKFGDYRYGVCTRNGYLSGGRFKPTKKIKKMFAKGEFEIYVLGRFDEKNAEIIALEKSNKSMFLRDWKIKCNSFKEAIEEHRKICEGGNK